ncbi:PREDICTED: 4-substituted benzoates-glutamate ligase GH3.12-like [Tarenaya hassleriana]|uniref:4-substituted benzoates-glutamate ligase GH3.12-like n=1 Tax=Tarenaya hassleriana TaxID=28532 RepID=UPI00053C2063|nr:PREDICTED: 4-substituted benzoates-glutamate ligase GH3.12-like [Tarenaya hassleriana]
MSTSFDLNDRVKVIEDPTKNVKQIQDRVLEEIVTRNMNTEYLRRFLDDGDGQFDKEHFKKNVPVVKYDDVKPYIERVFNGEPSDVISSAPITSLLLSSGTSGGAQKIIPCSNTFLENFLFINDLRMFVTSKQVDGVERGKGMMFFFATKPPQIHAPCGLPVWSATSSYFKSDYFTHRPSNWHTSYTSPDDVIFCPDSRQSLYCHLLCGLVRRDEVVRVGSFFASVLVRALKFLEDFWKELCSNIRLGHISEWITDPDCKNSVYPILGGPQPELADTIEHECSRKPWEGIVSRLWPNTKCVETIITGSMAQYIPALEFYGKDLPLISTIYGSSESVFGINLEPLSEPRDISYTFMPNASYFEFKHVDVDDDHGIVDLADVKLGLYYEPLVTNFSGLYRMRVGDVLLVTGFHNNAPQFRFVRRENVVLSIDTEKTNEEDLFKAVNIAKLRLESSALRLTDFTSYADTSTVPGHYVLYWELSRAEDDPELIPEVLEDCCFAVEESLDAVYKRCRSKDTCIGSLEIRVVRDGTFDSLMDFFVGEGASICQYKTPRCIQSSAKALDVMEERVIARFFSKKCPPLHGSIVFPI